MTNRLKQLALLLATLAFGQSLEDPDPYIIADGPR